MWATALRVVKQYHLGPIIPSYKCNSCHGRQTHKRGGNSVGREIKFGRDIPSEIPRKVIVCVGSSPTHPTKL